ncbi:MAG TPA: EAL domain-containing protein, partial [Pyrinomonadaceae bacterium]|nr:EAL domain-containing protein [Pyrinomonadaceae bacterium]
FGREPVDLIEENWQTVVHPNDLPECIENWTYALKTGNDYETEFRLLRRDGEYRWHLARASAGRDAQGNIVKWFGTNTDIHNQKLAESKLNHYARHDALTNLPNRVEFMSRLKDTIDRSFGNGWSRFAVLFLDLDRFKVINDSLGHDIGDKLLIAIAERLKSCVRPGDIVARLGGDEFTILLHRTGEIGDVEKIADRLQKRLSEPFQLGSYEVFTSVSIGIILSDGEHRQPEDYLRDADSAMYRAKDAGKARYEIFDREMHVRNMNLLRIETDLRHALERHEFEVNYQPIVSLRTGKVVEFEALLRWRHPEYGLVAPNEFISVAEETGLIIPIGRWILEEACRQTVEWQKRFPAFKSVPISVNLSAKQLMHPNLTTQVREILFKTSLKAKCLQLEVTESTVMEHHETAQQVLNELHDIGAHISTDDFGTGYSSLSYLHRFPFDRLKIDRSFINRMDSNEKCEAIVRTLLLLGQNLNLEIVAEGIETEKQLRQLQNLGCDYGQGYLFSKPVSAMKAEKLLQNGIENFPAEDSFVFGGNRELIEIRDIQ